MPQPIFGIIFGDNGTPANFSTAQAPAFEFRICCGSAGAVAFAELGNAHRPLQSSMLLLDFRFHIDIRHHGRDGPGDRARVCADDGEMNTDNTGRENS
jgi:hypothetical protein